MGNVEAVVFAMLPDVLTLEIMHYLNVWVWVRTDILPKHLAHALGLEEHINGTSSLSLPMDGKRMVVWEGDHARLFVNGKQEGQCSIHDGPRRGGLRGRFFGVRAPRIDMPHDGSHREKPWHGPYLWQFTKGKVTAWAAQQGVQSVTYYQLPVWLTPERVVSWGVAQDTVIFLTRKRLLTFHLYQLDSGTGYALLSSAKVTPSGDVFCSNHSHVFHLRRVTLADCNTAGIFLSLVENEMTENDVEHETG